MNRDERNAKRIEIESQTRAFLARGGKIRSASPSEYNRESTYYQIVERDRLKLDDMRDQLPPR